MGLFSSTKVIYPKKLEELLRQVEILDTGEREYVKEAMGKYMTGGLSKHEAEKALREMAQSSSDVIDRQEVEAIRQKLLEYFEGKIG